VTATALLAGTAALGQGRTDLMAIGAPREVKIETVRGEAASARIAATIPPEGLRQFAAAVQTLIEKDRGTVPEGDPCVALQPSEPKCVQSVGPIQVDAGTPLVAVFVDTRAMKSVGDYRGQLEFTASGAKGTTALRIVVTDSRWRAFWIIFAGVAASVLLTFLTGRFRVQQQNEIRLERVEKILAAWRGKLPPGSPDLKALETKLHDARIANTTYSLDEKTLAALESDAAGFKGGAVASAKVAQKPPGLLRRAARWLFRTPAGRLVGVELLVAVFSTLLATVVGLNTVYAPPFGRPEQVLGALLWGFGLDSSVRGFRAVFQKLDS